MPAADFGRAHDGTSEAGIGRAAPHHFTARSLLRRAVWLTPAALLAILAALPVPAAAPEDHSTLTRASFRRNCLLCHSAAQPEGVSPEILAGLHASSPGVRPRDAMPGVVCQRRCEACKLPEPAPAR